MEKVTLTLSHQVYNLLVMGVQEMPWKLANQIFQEIDPQVRAALAQEAAKEQVPPVEKVKGSR